MQSLNALAMKKINVNFLNKNQDVDEKSKYMYTALEEEEYDVIRSRCCPVSYRANRLRFFYFDITSTFLASSFFGNSMQSVPFLKVALALSTSIVEGNEIERSYFP